MKNIIKHLATIVILITLPACTTNNHSILGQYDEMALQDMQTQDFETTQKVAFASILSVLQDVGYIVEVADGDSGLITAISPSSSATNYNLFYGVINTRAQTKVTAFVESIGVDTSKIRLNFVTTTTSGPNNMTTSVDEPVVDPGVYNAVFERVSETIFVRQSLSE